MHDDVSNVKMAKISVMKFSFRDRESMYVRYIYIYTVYKYMLYIKLDIFINSSLLVFSCLSYIARL